jgi:hypothetical protein
MKKDILTLDDYNSLPEGTEMTYKSGGYGWWIGDEECGPRGGRQINSQMMASLERLGAGMTNPRTAASHQVRYSITTKKVCADDLMAAIDSLQRIWSIHRIGRYRDLKDVMAKESDDFRTAYYWPPSCFWAGRTGKQKAFIHRGYRWVYVYANLLSDYPRTLARIKTSFQGHDPMLEALKEMGASGVVRDSPQVRF